jgi:hypothetical protein
MNLDINETPKAASNSDKYVVFWVEGGLGKNVASTALAEIINKNHPDRKLIVVASWPEVFLNNPFVDRVYRIGNFPYFYRDYILDKDTIVFKGEPYFTSEHIQKKRHIILSWCDMFKLQYNGEQSKLFYNPKELEMVKASFGIRQKPILMMQTNGGMYGNQKPYCWTRDLPPHQAFQIYEKVKEKFHVIQITRDKSPKLPGAEILPEMNRRILLASVLVSQKRLLIDSCMQHAAAAFGLPSVVCWIGTSPNTFGYGIHKNLTPNVPKTMDNLIDSSLFDYNFEGAEHEYPYNTNDLFNVDEIVDMLMS